MKVLIIVAIDILLLLVCYSAVAFISWDLYWISEASIWGRDQRALLLYGVFLVLMAGSTITHFKVNK